MMKTPTLTDKWTINESYIFPETPILVYHHVRPPEASADKSIYGVTTDQFKRQMQYLKDSGFHCLKLSDFLQSQELKRHHKTKSFVLTFDDGCEDFYLHAYPILMNLGFTATIFLVSDFIGGKTKWEDKGESSLLSWEQIGTLANQGFTFASHTCSHACLVDLSERQVQYELSASKDRLETGLNQKIQYFAYPFSKSNKWIREMVRQVGYEAACGVVSGEPNLFNLWRCAIRYGDSLLTFRIKMTRWFNKTRLPIRWLRENTSLGLLLYRAKHHRFFANTQAS